MKPVIVFLGLSDHVATFLRRRITQLAAAGEEIVIVLGRRASFPVPLGVNVIWKWDAADGNARSMFVFVQWLLNVKVNYRLWRISSGSPTTRLRWCLTNYSWVRLRNVSVIHFQWLTTRDTLAIVDEFFPAAKVYISARGSQLTIHPFGNPALREMLNLNFNRASRIHCVSKDMRQACRDLGAPDEKLFVNYNGVDLSAFVPSAAISHGGVINLISVGALIWRKALAFQLLMIQGLRQMNINVMHRIVGDGPETEALRYLTHRLGIEDSVAFEGRKSEASVLRLLQESDVYLSTSLAEGLPNSLVEAAACGLPIVAFSCEGVQEIIDDGKTGYVLPYGDIAAAVDRITHLWKNPSDRIEMGAAARAKVEREFDYRPWVSRMIMDYHHSDQ